MLRQIVSLTDGFAVSFPCLISGFVLVAIATKTGPWTKTGVGSTQS